MRCYIVSVGTSLISKAKDNGCEVSTHDADWQHNATGNKGDLINFLQQNGGGERIEQIRSKCAELSSLFYDDGFTPGNDDRVLLVHTQTHMGRGCAESLEQALVNLGIETCRHEIEGLSEADSSEFYTRGLPNLLAFLHGKITQARSDGHEVILVPTGGYKAIIPYFVLAGILYECPCIYVYEDSELVVELPPLPLHVDLVRWSTLEPLVELFQGKQPDRVPNFVRSEETRRQLTHLLIEPQENNDDTGYTKSGLCTMLAERAEKDMARSALEYRTRHSPLLDLLDDDGGRYRNLFLRLASIGPYIWKGDRVPEMADHALLHHADLFQIAERILLPAFYFHRLQGTRFLSPLELLILLGALHLHDCGHVIGKVKLENGTTRSLYPTEIRDHHHVLGYLRLTDPQTYQGQKIVEVLKDAKGHGQAWTDAEGHGQAWTDAEGHGQAWTDAEGHGQAWTDAEGHGQAWTDAEVSTILKAMATVGLYHRKAMKFRENTPYEFVTGHAMAKIPNLDQFLKEHPITINGENLDFERIALLVSLLRIIDCLDEQAPRTGGGDAVRFHEAVLETEAEEEEDRAERLKAVIGALPAVAHNNAKMNFIETIGGCVDRLLGTYVKRESRDGGSDLAGSSNTATKKGTSQKDKFTANEFRRRIEKLLKKHNMGKYEPLIDEYLMATIRARFKRLQKEHFSKKLAIRRVIVVQDEITANGEKAIEYTIKLDMDESLNCWEKIRDGIVGGMLKEYEIEEKERGGEKIKPVQSYLNKAGIYFKFPTVQ